MPRSTRRYLSLATPMATRTQLQTHQPHPPFHYTTHSTTSISTAIPLIYNIALGLPQTPTPCTHRPPLRHLLRDPSTYHHEPHNVSPPSSMMLWTTRDTPNAVIRTQVCLMWPDLSRSLISPIPTINFDTWPLFPLLCNKGIVLHYPLTCSNLPVSTSV